MLGGNVKVWTENIQYWFIEDKTYTGMPRGAKKSLAPPWAKIECSTLKIKHYLQACTTSGKKLLILCGNNQSKFIGDRLLTKGSLSWRINYCNKGCLIVGSNPYLHRFKYRHSWAHLVNTQDQRLTAIRIYWSQLVILPSSASHGNFATSSLPSFSTPSLRNVCSRVDALTSLFPRHHKFCKPDKHRHPWVSSTETRWTS